MRGRAVGLGGALRDTDARPWMGSQALPSFSRVAPHLCCGELRPRPAVPGSIAPGVGGVLPLGGARRAVAGGVAALLGGAAARGRLGLGVGLSVPAARALKGAVRLSRDRCRGRLRAWKAPPVAAPTPHIPKLWAPFAAVLRFWGPRPVSGKSQQLEGDSIPLSCLESTPNHKKYNNSICCDMVFRERQDSVPQASRGFA